MRLLPKFRFSFFKRTAHSRTIDPDEIFLDSSNLPAFERSRMEGVIETPIGRKAPMFIALVAFVLLVVFSGKLFSLQIVQGGMYAAISESNRTNEALVFAERGVIYDRNGVLMAWNIPTVATTSAVIVPEGTTFSSRTYRANPGSAHVLGYVTLPRRDSGGHFYRTSVEGVSGVEEALNESISGANGSTIIETDALGTVLSETAQATPADGAPLYLSVDARVQDIVARTISSVAATSGFIGGAGVIMDVHTGELVALTSYPEFSPAVMTAGTNTEAIAAFQHDAHQPFLNRALSGLYTPGSIMKPFVALAALGEGVITPERQILSTGVLNVPNPYVPGAFTRFIDWRAHGLVDMRRALAVSSNIYFYEVGGGFGQQKGVGIAKLEEYMRRFGIAQKSGIILSGEKQGIIPNPAWKLAVFGEPWRLGDTYNTSIGQYGFLVTPLSMARATAAIANKGTLVTPSIVKGATVKSIPIEGIEKEHYQVVQEGMRQAVNEGTTQALKTPGVAIAAKTGTAQVGRNNEMVNSWVIGFFPADNPRYSFALLLERAPAGPPFGAPYAMSKIIQEIGREAPEYLNPGE